MIPAVKKNLGIVLGLIREGALPEFQLILREQVYVTRLMRQEDYAQRHRRLLVPEPQMYLASGVGVDTLYWAERHFNPLEADELKIRILSTALNFRDVLKAMHLYPGEAGDFGYEAVGEVLDVGRAVENFKAGDRVIAMGQGLSAGEAVVKKVQVALLPEGLSSAQGASIPVVFLTAHYALNTLAKIKKGQKVLIHAASGGVGLAAIELARSKGALIYATTSTPKQSYLKERGIEYIYDSRSLEFSQNILKDTDGIGVDIVLNSLTSPGFIEASLACLKEGGVFLEIGKLNIYSQAQMDNVRPDVRYYVIEHDRRLAEEPRQIQEELQALLALFAQNKLSPLPVTEYSVTETMEAFNYLQQARHIGKIVVNNPQPFTYNPNATYLITGGTGGLGIELARHLITKGVKHLALTSRSKASEALIHWMEAQQAQGVDIVHYHADVTDKKALKRVFAAIAKSAYPLKGLFHAAGLIKDALIKDLRDEDFNAVLAPKVQGSMHLHELSQNLHLDCFVLFSSVASFLGNTGQSNYSAANAFMDALSISRHQQGLPALSINWGPFAKVGMAAGLETVHRAQGLHPIDTDSAFELMDTLLYTADARVGVMDADWSRMSTQDNPYLEYFTRPKAQGHGEWLILLEATPKEHREQVLTDKIRGLVADILHVGDANLVDVNKGFFELGMDSLMAVELKNKLQAKVGSAMTLTNTVAFDYASIKALQEYLMQGLSFKDKAHIPINSNRTDANEEIAIIGLSGEFPGASTLDDFWQLLLEGKEGISEVPASRWDINAYYDANPEAPGKMISRRGGFIADLNQFDAGFFAISPKEAQYLDPQQRLLLKHSWLALESAGIAPDSLHGSDTGVFIGIATSDYSTLINQRGSINEINAYFGTGNSSSTASGRISFILGLQGPNLAIDTACSSSLVALNEACERLQHGACTHALVGGVNAILSPELSINFSKAGMLAPDGKCKTFDEKADGYVRGEGCGVVVLKRLSDALRDNNPIWAVIKASGINQDGASSGLTVPNGQAQERLLTNVLAQSHLSADAIDYVECHGTGTRLGDPIEIHALGEVYGKNRKPDQPLMLGSVKTNIGHLEAAAGIAGLIKVALSLRYKKIPKHLNFKQLNSNITLNFPARIVSETTEWYSNNKPRIAALSSFGFSGTNAHVILEEAPVTQVQEKADPVLQEQLFVLSAKTQKSLHALIQSYMNYLEQTQDNLEDICYTASIGRAHFNYRIALCVTDKKELLKQLINFDGKGIETVAVDEVITSKDINVLMTAYLSGKRIDWEAYYKPYEQFLHKIDLPSYCFDTQYYWLEHRASLLPKAMPNRHVLLQNESINRKEHRYLFTTILNEQFPDFLNDHRVYGEVVVAGSTYVSAMISFAFQILKLSCASLISFEFLQPLVIAKGSKRELQISVKEESSEYSFEIYSSVEGNESEIITHASGRLKGESALPIEFVAIEEIKTRSPKIHLSKDHQAFVGKMGLGIGAHYNWLKEVYYNERELLAEMRTPEENELEGFELHPGLIDSSFQSALIWRGEGSTLLIPISIGQVSFSKQRPQWIYLKRVDETHSQIEYLDANGLIIARFMSFNGREISEPMLKKILQQQTKSINYYYDERYELYELPVSKGDNKTAVLVFSSEAEYASLCKQYEKGDSLQYSSEFVQESLSKKHVVFVYADNFIELFALAQRMIDSPPLSFTLVTQHALGTDKKDKINPVHTQVIGFWKTLSLEMNSPPCYLVDVACMDAIKPILELIREDGLSERMLIVRDKIYIPRLEELDNKLPAEPYQYEAQATYLITGGTGGLGFALANHLIAKGVRHLVLTSRHKPSDALRQWIEEQQTQGVYITHYSVDVANKKALKTVFDDLIKSEFPLKGLFHAAGILKDALLSNLTKEDMDLVLAPKVKGSMNLHELSKKCSLDFFILFSSIAALLGNLGQANYAAANTFMDGLALRRRQEGLPALSINWGPFATVGMAADLESQHRMQGFIPLDAHQSFQLMDCLLTADYGQLGFAHIDWSKMLNQRNPYLSHLVPLKNQLQGEWVTLLDATPPQNREQVLMSHMKNILGEVLSIKDYTTISAAKGFFDLGMDSLMAVDLKNRLQSKLGDSIVLSNTLAFDYSNLNALRDYLMQGLAFKEKEAITTVVRSNMGEDEDIAIIGISGEFPGAKDTDAYWQMLSSGREGISEVPADRWDVDAYYDPNPAAAGKIVTRRGGFIEEIDQFDASFFAISPKEAEYLDPQQRLLLKHSWIALEQAGIALEHFDGRKVGVFIGISTHDYSILMNKSNGTELINAYGNTGNAHSTATGRLSYFLGFQGPNYAIDTACSSSLVALNEACERLQKGECSSALVGGVNAILSPEVSIGFSKAGMLAPDGKCKTFDEKADGYVRGEGCGVVVLKRLSDALRDNDSIWAVIKSSGINQDGASSGLTVPSGQAQERLLTQVLAQAGLSANDIDYVECHGTGTSLGDPIEVHALGAVYGQKREPDHPLLLGSVKTNIGHLEAAAGIAGLIKVVLSLKYQKIPKHLNFNQLNPKITLNFPAQIVTQTIDWASNNKPRRAALSSFGFSGTNAHVILEEAPIRKLNEEQVVFPEGLVFVISAKSKRSLNELVQSYIYYLKHSSERFEDICYSTAVGRCAFSFRLALIAHSKKELLEKLSLLTLDADEVVLSDEVVTSDDIKTLCSAFLEGKNCDWLSYYSPYAAVLRKVHLPIYVFDRQSYWLEMKKHKALGYGVSVHELLGTKLPGYGGEIRFLNVLDLSEQKYIKAHEVFGAILVPGAGFIESALAAGQVLKEGFPIVLQNVTLLKPLRLLSGTLYDYQVSLIPTSSGYQGRIDSHKHNDSDWDQHGTFHLSLDAIRVHQVVDIEALKKDKTRKDLTDFYAQLAQMGLNYGTEFQVISEAYVGKGQALVRVALQGELWTTNYCMHPTLLDGVFQAIALLIDKRCTYIPAMVDSLACYQPLGQQAWIEVQLLNQSKETLSANLTVYDEQGVLLAQIEGFHARATNRNSLYQLINPVKLPDVYVEVVEAYTLPPVVSGVSQVMVYANDKAYATLNAPTHWIQINKTKPDWSSHHVAVVYEGDLGELVSLTQQALKEPPLSLTLLVHHAFAVADDSVIEPAHREALGLWRTVTNETRGSLSCYLIDSIPLSDACGVLELIAQASLPEPELIVRAQQAYVPRLEHKEEALRRVHQLAAPDKTQFLLSTSGIDTLHWAKRPEWTLGAKQVQVQIRVTALNFRDVLNAMDLYPGNAGDLGYECAGDVLAVGSEVVGLKPGDRVVVMGQGLFGFEVVVDSSQVSILANNISYAEGAAVPIVFLTANYGLNWLAQIKPGQKVLIHAATGGLGLAAIAFARLAGAEVYATASLKKQAYLRNELGIEHVYDSRSIDFGAQILSETHGHGVDIVLNSLTSEGFIAASLTCLKKGGVFLENGKLNIYSAEQMHATRPDVAYHIIAIDTLLAKEPEALQTQLVGILEKIEQGALRPIPVKEYSVNDTIAAFHYLQEAQHIGKVVVTNPQPYHYQSTASYLITGGTGGLGLELRSI